MTLPARVRFVTLAVRDLPWMAAFFRQFQQEYAPPQGRLKSDPEARRTSAGRLSMLADSLRRARRTFDLLLVMGASCLLLLGPSPVSADSPEADAGLTSLGRPVFVIYVAPRDRDHVAADSVIAWRFNDATAGRFKPGQFVVQKGQPQRFKLVDVKRAGQAIYHLVYDVYDDRAERPVKTGQVLVYDARPRGQK